MNKRYKFKYRSKALNTFYVCLQNFALGLLTIPFSILILWILTLFKYDVTPIILPMIWTMVIIVFAFFQTVYWVNHKGLTITDDKLLIEYACIVPPVHMFEKEILIKGIESAEFCNEPVSQRIEEVEGGAYNEPYVLIKYGYGGRKEVRLPLQNAENFIETINEMIKEQGA
ncbi:MAG: hypothetical protein IJI47_01970 [Eubacterium sp.]|nr:hypothetical protein [Eubacterium sp.]